MLPPLARLALHDQEHEHEACDTGVGIRKQGWEKRARARHDALQRGTRNRQYQQLEADIRDAIRNTVSVQQFCDLRVGAEFTYTWERVRAKFKSARQILDAFRSLADALFTPQLQAPREQEWTVTLSPDTAKSIARAFFATRTHAAHSYFPEQRTTRSTEALSTTVRTQFEGPLETLKQEALKALWNVREDNGDVGRVTVTLQLQGVQKKMYRAIADRAHMDNSSDLGGEEYAADPSGLVTNFFITSFCACALADDSVSLRGCGTVLLDGIPMVAPEAMRDAASLLERNLSLRCSFEELLQTLETAAARATSEILGEYEPDDLVELGVGLRMTPPLAWTQSNRTTFHRSPNREEVLSVVEYDRPAMRALVSVDVESTADVEKMAEEENEDEEPQTRTYAFSNHNAHSPGNHPLAIEIRLGVAFA